MSLEQTEIIELATKIAKMEKPRSSMLVGLFNVNKKELLPEYWSGYNRAINNLERIKVHAELDYFPEKLFSKNSPNQSDKELDYIKETYEQTTNSVFADFSNTIKRAWADNNWTITYGEETSKYVTAKQTFQDYVETKIPTFESIESWAKTTLIDLKLMDSEGVICIRPEVVLDENGKISSTELNAPVPLYYDCSKVMAFTDKYCMIDLSQRSDKNFKFVFELYDDTNIYLIKQTNDDKSKPVWDIAIYYAHEWGKVPATKLKGIPKVEENEIRWISPFSFSVGILNNIILDAANLRIIKNKCGYPYTVMLGNECVFKKTFTDGTISSCRGGIIFDSELKKDVFCESCHGTGMHNRITPQGQMMIRASDKFNEGETTGIKPLEFVSPSPEMFTLLRNEIGQQENDARRILHLTESTSNVKGSDNGDTALGKALDEKQKYAFIKPISDQTFQVFEFVLNAIGWMRYKNDFNAPTIKYPNTFDFKNESDYLLEISEAMKANLPPFVIQTIVMQYVRSFFFNDEKSAMVFSLILEADKLLVMTSNEISLNLGKGLIAPWQVILHAMPFQLIKKLESEDKGFWKKNIMEQITSLEEAAKKEYDANKPKDNKQQSIIEDILKPVA